MTWTTGGYQGELVIYICDNGDCGRRIEMNAANAAARYPGYNQYDATKMGATQCGWSFTERNKMYCEKCVTRPPWDIEQGVMVDVTGNIPSPAPVIPSAPPPLPTKRELDFE